MKEYLPQIIATVIALILLPTAKFTMRRLVFRYGKIAHKADARMQQVKQIFYIIINILFVITIALIWGLDQKNIIGGLSAVFAVIGVALFAQWSILSNVTAGIVMFFGAPFRVGDTIRIIDKDAPIEATIESITMFYTHIRSVSGELIVIPNSIFLQKIVALDNSPKEDKENYD